MYNTHIDRGHIPGISRVEGVFLQMVMGSGRMVVSRSGGCGGMVMVVLGAYDALGRLN